MMDAAQRSRMRRLETNVNRLLEQNRVLAETLNKVTETMKRFNIALEKMGEVVDGDV